MKTLKLFGASDDLLEIRGVDADEINVYPRTAYVGAIAVKGNDGQINVHVIYDGSWAFAIAPQDGDCDTLPPWEIRRSFGGDSPYSETLEIDIPADAVWKFEEAS